MTPPGDWGGRQRAAREGRWRGQKLGSEGYEKGRKVEVRAKTKDRLRAGGGRRGDEKGGQGGKEMKTEKKRKERGEKTKKEGEETL